MSNTFLFPKMEVDSLRESLNLIPEFNSIRLQLRPELIYIAGTNFINEILEELEPGEAVAVTLETREDSKKVLDLEAKIKIYEEKIESYLDGIVAGLGIRTSKFTKCPDCGSNISVPHIKSLNCPVCGSRELLMTTTHHKKLAGYREYITDYEQRIIEIRASQRSKVLSKQWMVVTH